jgi:ketosteroid isomerase-like protein
MGSDEDLIRELVKKWLAASEAGDVETVLSLMADDVVFLVPGPTLSILEKRNGRWLLARDANMLGPEAG